MHIGILHPESAFAADDPPIWSQDCTIIVLESYMQDIPTQIRVEHTWNYAALVQELLMILA